MCWKGIHRLGGRADGRVAGAKLLGCGPQAVRQLWEAGRLGLGATSTEKMEFPAMRLRQAIEAFTAAAYGKRRTFEHA